MANMTKKITKTPYIATKKSSFEHIREMKHVELTTWFKEHSHFYNKIKSGNRATYVLKMVSKLMYVNMLRKNIIKTN